MSPRPAIGHLRRPQLIAAATEMIYEKGFADTRTVDIAERAGVSAPNVLYHFESKDSLLEQAFSVASDQWFASVRLGLDKLDRYADKIVHVINHILVPHRPIDDYTLEIETFSRALRSEGVREAAARDAQRYVDILESIVREGQRVGEFTAHVDPHEIALVLLAMFDGFGVSVRLGLMGVDASQAANLAVRFAARLLGFESPASAGATRATPRRERKR